MIQDTSIEPCINPEMIQSIAILTSHLHLLDQTQNTEKIQGRQHQVVKDQAHMTVKLQNLLYE